MEKQPILSIIVPVFNTEPYLDECLESILGQNLQNYEVIVVNDGSTDDSEKIIFKYLNNNNLKYIKQPNAGLSVARNIGMKNAKGKYIAFCDSDDWVDLDYYSSMIEKAESTSSEVLIAGFYNSIDNSKHMTAFKTGGPRSFKELCIGNKKIHSNGDLCFVPRYIYSMKFLLTNSIVFEEDIKIGEDVIFNISSLSAATRILITDYCGYHYRIRNNSLMRSKKYRQDLSVHLIHQIQRKFDLSIQYGLHRNEKWMDDLNYFVMVGSLSTLLNNAMLSNRKYKAIREILNIKIILNSLKYNLRNGSMLINGRVNSFIRLCCYLRLTLVIYIVYSIRFNKV